MNRPPFDTVEAESELVGGFHTEYSSIRFALFFLAEFMNTITMSAIMVTLFFGGPQGWHPNIHHLNWLFPILWFVLKTSIFCFCYVWFRGALPRFRYDQLMSLGWKHAHPDLARVAAAHRRLPHQRLVGPRDGGCGACLRRSSSVAPSSSATSASTATTRSSTPSRERPIPPWELRRQTDGEADE